MAATVEHRQLSVIPAPFVGEFLQQQALPAAVALAIVAGELAVDLEVQGTPDQLKALRLAAGREVFLDTAIDHDVGVLLIQVQAIGEHRLLETQAQAFDVRVFAGVDLGQQQFEY
ncbi:hypothetical protein D3C75_996680 [compost metagenome]